MHKQTARHNYHCVQEPRLVQHDHALLHVNVIDSTLIVSETVRLRDIRATRQPDPHHIFIHFRQFIILN